MVLRGAPCLHNPAGISCRAATWLTVLSDKDGNANLIVFTYLELNQPIT